MTERERERGREGREGGGEAFYLTTVTIDRIIQRWW